MPADYILWVPGILLVVVGIVFYRWLSLLQTRVNDHAERIAWLESRANGIHERRTEP